jgi:hypothetical protein
MTPGELLGYTAIAVIMLIALVWWIRSMTGLKNKAFRRK